MIDAPYVSPVHVSRLSQGPRKVLAIHCTMAKASAWTGIARALEPVAGVTAFDLPSHGRSADWAGPGDLVDAVAGIAAGLISAPVDLLGHSFGGVAALWLTLTRPELVRSLTLIEPVLLAIARGSPELADHDRIAAPIDRMAAEGDTAGAAAFFNTMWSDPQAPDWTDLPEAMRAGMTRALPFLEASSPALIKDSLGMLTRGRLEAVAQPVQILRGSETMPVIGVVNDALVSRLPQAENKIIIGAGHMLPITHAAQTATEIRAFFDQNPY
ncbi:MAG: alpha/beta hydrolase [Pseudomonadota bacterium]